MMHKDLKRKDLKRLVKNAYGIANSTEGPVGIARGENVGRVMAALIQAAAINPWFKAALLEEPESEKE